MTSPHFRRVARTEFTALWQDSATPIRVIAAHYGMCPDSIRRRAVMLGLPPRGPYIKPPHITPDQCEFFRAAWAMGCGIEDMAAHFDVTARTISNTVARLGLEKRGGGKRPKATIAKILAKMAQIRANDALKATAKADRAAWVNAEMMDGRQHPTRRAA